MPGKKITIHQADVYMKLRKSGLNQTISAAKAGFSERSGRNIEQTGGLPTPADVLNQKETGKHNVISKKINDPLEKVWDTVLVPLLESTPNLASTTLLEHIQDLHPGQYPESILRTLQRRVSQWKAVYGPEQEVIFRQLHAPGKQSLSDFTTLKGVEITIKGEVLNHLLYHFRLAFSHWSFMKVILGGESFTALSESMQDALWTLGLCTDEHRSDSLSAAYINLSANDQEDMTKAYEAVCSHYGMVATRNNRGKGHENGSIESAHGHLKRRIEQALLLRGSYDFESVEEYQSLIDAVVQKHNNRHAAQLYIERPHLKPLPSRRAIDFTETVSRVTTSSTISVKKVLYSVPSRLIGYQLKVHIYDSRLECYLGSDHVLSLPRIRGDKCNDEKWQRARCINYRHLINSLVKKPGAFRYSILRDDILPNKTYRDIWQLVEKQGNGNYSSKLMVGILKLAADCDCEEELGKFVLSSLKKGNVPSLGSLQAKYQSKIVSNDNSSGTNGCGESDSSMTKNGDNAVLQGHMSTVVKQHSLQTYNDLLSAEIAGGRYA